MSMNKHQNEKQKDSVSNKNPSKINVAVQNSTSTTYDEDFPPLDKAVIMSKTASRKQSFTAKSSLPRPSADISLASLMKGANTGANASSIVTRNNHQSARRYSSYNTYQTNSDTNFLEEIEVAIGKIILSIHEHGDYVAVEQVDGAVLEHYQVQSYRDLGIYHLTDIKSRANLIKRSKDVTFYMQVFKETFNLCTIFDLNALIANFLQLNTYDDANLGPLHKHPSVQQIFQFKPKKRNESVPRMTSGEIIAKFLEFHQANQHIRYNYEDFLDQLVHTYRLENREQLGLFCRSFPYLTQVCNRLSREWRISSKRIESNAVKCITDEIERKLQEIKDDVTSHLDFSMYTSKSPMAVFDHLLSMVDKYLIIAQQKAIRDLLLKLRSDELLRCILNISIYLGSLEKPEKFVAEFQRLTKASTNNHEQRTEEPSKINNDTNQHQMNIPQTSTICAKRINDNKSSMIHETSFAEFDSKNHEIEPMRSLKDVCSDLFSIFIRYDSILSMQQLYSIKTHICKKYSINDFTQLRFKDSSIDDGDGQNKYLDLISFIQQYRSKIDPNGDLSIYDYLSTNVGDRQELYTFVKQLTAFTDWSEKQEQNQATNNRTALMTKEQTSAVERALQYKFPGSIVNNQVFQIIKKAKQQISRNSRSIIRYEEALLDETSLSRLGLTPSSIRLDEDQLCKIILQCPVMSDLLTWLQWPTNFQTRHGTLKSFITRKEDKFTGLFLLETSDHELLRLPVDSSFDRFEKELLEGNIRISVGHLCALIVYEYVTVNRLPMFIYKQTVSKWLIRMRSSAELDPVNSEPMIYVLEFLTYLPILIGHSRIVAELLLDTIDEVYVDDHGEEIIQPRKRIWELANIHQRNKLEVWGHLLDIDEWKRENKWKGLDEFQEEPNLQLTYQQYRSLNVSSQVTGSSVFHSDTTLEVVEAVHVPEMTHPVAVAPILATSDAATPTATISNTISTGQNMAAFEHIKMIRKGLGVDNELNEDGQYIVNNLQGVLTRGLEKLADDLYSEQGHFVLELIQNADDNRYLLNCLPTLRFVVTSDRILVCNNEIGFQPEHVGAICNIGSSTKGKHKQGYAGHKGIGFKSVFMISSCPEIHSAGYHFCFDTENGIKKIGYICPVWLNQCEEQLPEIHQWSTCIRLPIKPTKRNHRLKQNFNDIHAKLLLFLNRLRQIEIIRQKTNDTTDSQVFTRIDHADGKIIELQNKNNLNEITKSFWLVVKQIISIPTDIKRQFSDIKCDAESTTIAIAYPLDHIHDGSSCDNLQYQSLFAYLPLRSYGFRFILQGDFEVPATRQEVLRDNGWNEWLKQEMIQLLPLAYQDFRKLPEILQNCSTDVQSYFGSLNVTQAIKYFLKTIPTHNEVDPYFNSFIDRSIQGLLGFLELPIIADQTTQIIKWMSPKQCFYVRDTFIKQIFSSDLLLSHFNSYYLSEDFVHECDASILKSLGCQKLDFSAILQLIRSLYAQNSQEHNTKTTNIEQIAQWLLCIDYSLQQERERPGFTIDDNHENEQTTMEELKKLKILPLKGQTQLVSIEQYQPRTIFFPLEKSIPFEKHVKLVFEDLPTIDDRLLEFIERKYPHRLVSIKQLLKELGVSESRNSRKVYSNHMLPIMSDLGQWLTKSDAVLIAYVIFIYKELYSPNPGHFASEMEKLKTKLIIRTRQGKFIPLNQKGANIIHLPLSYDCSVSLDLLKLPKYQFTFISDDYYQEYNKEIFHQNRDRRQFVQFLNELDIEGFFLIKTVQTKYFKVEQLAETNWKHHTEHLSTLLFEPFIIQDNRCEEFEALISSKECADAEHYSQILCYLSQCYDKVKEFFSASIFLSRDHFPGSPKSVQGIESSFCLSLKRRAWIPVANGLLYKPNDVYHLPMNHPFRRYVPCIDLSKIRLTDENFISLLEMKREITTETMFELLMKWSCRLESDSLWKLLKLDNESAEDLIPCTMTSDMRQSYRDTINNIIQIYGFLRQDQAITRNLRRFRRWPLIFIPRTHDIGEFLFSTDVFWNDPEMMLSTGNSLHYQSQQRIALQSYYGKYPVFHELFVKTLEVQEKPSLEDYLPLLSNLADKNTSYIWKCIQVITHLAFDQVKQATIRDKCLHYEFIPCMGCKPRLAKYTDQLYYPHDLMIAHLFKDVASLVFIPDEMACASDFKHKFCSLFNIKDLETVIQVFIDVKDTRPSDDLFQFYHHSIDLIQYYLLRHGFMSEDRSNYLQSILSEISFISVDSISLTYEFEERITRKMNTTPILASYIDESAKKFYILQKYEKSENRHIDTMVNYLTKDKVQRLELAKYIRKLYNIFQDYGIDGLDKQRGGLPEQTIPKWIIPEIIIEAPVATNEGEGEGEEEESEKQAENNPDLIEVSSEKLQKLLNEPLISIPNKKQSLPNDSDQPRTLTSFPANIPTKSTTNAPCSTNLPSTETFQTDKTSSENISFASSITKDSPKEKQDIKPMQLKASEQPSNNTGESSSNNIRKPTAETMAPAITISHFTAPSRIDFEKIHVSIFTNVNLPSSTTSEPSCSVKDESSKIDIDRITGHRGEGLVYQYLQWKYPDRDIQWLNKDSESGKPFDIQMIQKGKKDRFDLIEVKTTRSKEQHTFGISIKEIECLIENPDKYHIYRVYYCSEETSSTITILSHIKANMERKHLSLFMTIPK